MTAEVAQVLRDALIGMGTRGPRTSGQEFGRNPKEYGVADVLTCIKRVQTDLTARQRALLRAMAEGRLDLNTIPTALAPDWEALCQSLHPHMQRKGIVP